MDKIPSQKHVLHRMAGMVKTAWAEIILLHVHALVQAVSTLWMAPPHVFHLFLEYASFSFRIYHLTKVWVMVMKRSWKIQELFRGGDQEDFMTDGF